MNVDVGVLGESGRTSAIGGSRQLRTTGCRARRDAHSSGWSRSRGGGIQWRTGLSGSVASVVRRLSSRIFERETSKVLHPDTGQSSSSSHHLSSWSGSHQKCECQAQDARASPRNAVEIRVPPPSCSASFVATTWFAPSTRRPT